MEDYDFISPDDFGDDIMSLSFMNRLLAAAKDNAKKIDYNVLAVAAMTLVLILLVELIRHRLDHAAAHRPFFQSVLEGVYAELATLGIVEFFLFLITQYKSDYDKAKKDVFADVHFLFFYTAIINALQTALNAVVTTRVSRRIWVETEMLELNHYVEIREEFDRVKKKLDRLNNRDSEISTREVPPSTERMADVEGEGEGATTHRSNETSDQDLGANQRNGTNSRSSLSESVFEHAFEFNRRSMYNMWRELWDQIRYPRLRRKYNELLVQIRFHELRVHFLQAYDLPLKLKISDYLIRSEQAVLIKLVQVSPVAWLFLTGGICLLYYVLGMVFYKYMSEILVGKVMTWIFFFFIALFVVISWFVSNKMKSIFLVMMREQTLWDVQDTDIEEKERLSKQQLRLFWFGKPKNVIAAIQSMQFGYALAISTVIIFWQEIDEGSVGTEWFLVAIFLCYGSFVQVTGQTLPRYTLCTSLGQLVDERRLRETVALFRLDEAKQKQKELLDFQCFEKGLIIQEGLRRLQTGEDDFSKSANLSSDTKNVFEAGECHEINSSSLQKAGTVDTPIDAASLKEFPVSEDQLFAGYADSKATDANPLLPSLFEVGQSRISHREGARQRKDNRRKVHSDGVAVMAEMSDHRSSFEGDGLASLGEERSFKTHKDFDHVPRRRNTQLLNIEEPVEDTGNERALARSRRDRRARRKSVSDGVAFMASLVESESECGFTGGTRTTKPFSFGRVGVKFPMMEDSPTGKFSRDAKKVDTGDLMAELVKLDTESLRATLPELEQKRLLDREGAKQKRRSRHRTVSDGVAAMAAMGGNLSSAAGKALASLQTKDDSKLGWVRPSRLSGTNEGTEGDDLLDGPRPPRRANRHTRQRSVSDGVAAMSRAGIEIERPALSHGSVHPFMGSASSRDDVPPRLPAPVVLPSTIIENSKGPEHPVVQTQTPENGTNQENASQDSSSSMDAYSDADDVPETTPSLSTKRVQENTLGPSLLERLHDHFLTERYVAISNIFGTLFAFFLVGQRVEGFIHSESIISEEFVAIYVPLEISFWLLTTLFCLFLAASGLIFYLMWIYGHLESCKEREALAAAAIDCPIIVICLSVFFIAEAQRCCVATKNDNSRYLAEEVLNEDEYAMLGPAPCSCPPFGSRQYSGLGTIEPYTSLVCLRAFRHWIARSCVGYLSRKYEWSKTGDNEDVSSHNGAIAVNLIEEDHSRSHKDAATVVAEVWESTIGKHPELVAQYGEFSGEVLRAMLGVALIETQALPMGEEEETQSDSDLDLKPKKRDILKKSKSFTLEKEYSGLSPEAQEVIIAGKLGCSVIKSSSQPKLQALVHLPATIPEESENHDFALSANQNLVFEIDSNSPSMDETLIFTSPNARLVRSMRRCDRKLLPILDQWIAVDVVMTRYELVYFDAVGVDDVALNRSAEGCRQALIATKGGKGLRLCDVAVGRRVVGHLSFSDVASVYVERIIPCSGSIDLEDHPVAEPLKTEFWKHARRSSSRGLSRRNEWNTVKQDRLTIQTAHGHTLYLRFYADLDDAEHNSLRLAQEDEVSGPIFKNNAFQWAQTIVRYCGPEQLKQSLPHFGDDTSEELRDILVVIHGSAETKEHRRNKSGDTLFRRRAPSHRRFASTDSLFHLALAESRQGSHKRADNDSQSPVSRVEAGKDATELRSDDMGMKRKVSFSDV